jgi:transcriptional regulator GlxA family with amidase domain
LKFPSTKPISFLVRHFKGERPITPLGMQSTQAEIEAQFSVLLSAESAVSPSIRKLQAWLPEHLTEDLSVPALARRAGMSPRTFQRVFTKEVGKGPSLHV